MKTDTVIYYTAIGQTEGENMMCYHLTWKQRLFSKRDLPVSNLLPKYL